MEELTSGINRLKELIERDDNITIPKLADHVKEADIEIEDLIPYADFNHPLEDGYGRKLVVEGRHFEIMVMSWNPGDFSAIHNHGYTSWGAVQVFGDIMHHIFSIKNGQFAITKKEILPNGTIIKVNNPLIHQMGNVTTNPYLTLHIYGDNDYEGDVTSDSRIFELETGLIKHTTGGAFFNLPDDQVYDVEAMPEIDERTFVHQASILRQYYQRYGDEKKEILTRQLLNKLKKSQLLNRTQL